MTLNDLQRSAKSCPVFQQVLFRVREVVAKNPARADFSSWSEVFSGILASLGWPGDQELRPEEKDVVERWKDKLSKLASLTLINQRVGFHEALEQLQSLLDEPGPAQGDFFSPIQILDASEATGLRFDQVFVTGVSEENSFLHRSTSPLIPLKLQRACDVPGATANGLHALRHQVLSELFSAAPQVYVTYSNRLLPAAEQFLPRDMTGWPRWEGRSRIESFAAADLERLEDSNAPPYAGASRSLGGTGLIKDQSQCPFRAFAVRRLNARCPEDGSFGLDARERGGFVHEALQIVWDTLKTQEGLKNCEPSSLRALVVDAVRQAVGTQQDGPLHQQLSLAEIDRLTELILAVVGD